MKRKITFLLTCLVSLSCFGQQNYRLLGSVSGCEDCVVSLLIKENPARYKLIKTQTATVRNDTFSFEGNIDEPAHRASLQFKKSASQSFTGDFVLDQGDSHVFCDLKTSKQGRITIVVPNSASNQIKVKTDSLWRSFYDSYRQEIGKTGFFELSREKEFELNKAYLSVVDQYRDCYFALVKLDEVSRYASMVRKDSLILHHLDLLDNQLQSTPVALALRERVMSHITIENSMKLKNQVPAFSVTDEKGKLFHNSSLRGQPYIIAFSATWCIPCQQHLKSLKVIYDKYRGKGLRVVYFNMDDDVERWQKHIKANALSWINVSERTKKSKIGDQFSVRMIPEYIVVDKTGSMIFNTHLNDDVDSMEKYVQQAVAD